MALTKVNNRMIDGSYLNVADFGATGDGTDQTTAIQNAINHALHQDNDIGTIFFPDGHYKYSALTVEFASDSTRRSGRVRFLGCGNLAIANLRSLQSGETDGLYGTVLECTGTTGLEVADSAAGVSPYPVRKFEAENITFVANNTNQVIEAYSCVSLYLKQCSIKQLNKDGNGIIAKSSWFFDLDRCLILGATDNATRDPVANMKGAGVIGGTDTFAGLWTIRNCLIDSWRDGVDWQDGEFVNVALRDTAVQHCQRHHVHVSGGTIRQLTLDNVYMECLKVTGTSFIKGGLTSGNAHLKSLIVKSSFFLAGSTSGSSPNRVASSSFITGPAIDLESCQSVDISNCFIYRLGKTFLNIDAVENNSQFTGKVKNNVFIWDADTFDNITTPVYLVETGSSVPLPILENNVLSGAPGLNEAVEEFQLYNTFDKSIPQVNDSRSGVRSIPKLSVGEVFKGTLSSTISLGFTANTYREYTCDTASLNLRLPNRVESPQGRAFVIKNSADSTQSFTVANAASSIKSLAPGETGFFTLESGNYTEVATASQSDFVYDFDSPASSSSIFVYVNGVLKTRTGEDPDYSLTLSTKTVSFLTGKEPATDDVVVIGKSEYSLFYLAAESAGSAADAIVDGDFTSNGLMKRTGAGTYTTVTDNSDNWLVKNAQNSITHGGTPAFDFTATNGPTGLRFSSGKATSAQVDMVYRTTPETLQFERVSDGNDILMMDPSDLSVTIGGTVTAGNITVSTSDPEVAFTDPAGTMRWRNQDGANMRLLDDTTIRLNIARTTGALIIGGNDSGLFDDTAGSGQAFAGSDSSTGNTIKRQNPNADAATLALNNTGTEGEILDFRYDGATRGSVRTRGTGAALVIHSQRSGVTGVGLDLADTAITPTSQTGARIDNSRDFGSASYRWDDIYATNTTIQTSDRNEKQDIEALTEAEQRVAVACKGLLRKYRWRSSVQEKGDEARVHFGIIAQDLQDAFAAEGLDAGRYGMFISSTWTDDETGEERTRLGVRYSELLAFIIAAL